MRRVVMVSTMILAVLICPSRPLFAQATERWHLLVPPAAYDKVEKRFVRIGDAPLVEWYHQGEFASYGECHDARASKALEAERKSNETKDTDGFYRTEAWAYQHGRCLSSKEAR